MAPQRLALLLALALSVAAGATAGCDDRPARKKDPASEDDASGTSESEPPQVPGAPAPSGSTDPETQPRDLNRDCLRRAAGIAGWRNYLARWSTAAYRGVSLPSLEPTESTQFRPVRPSTDHPTVAVGSTGVFVDRTSIYERESQGDSWSDSEIEAAAEALRNADLAGDDGSDHPGGISQIRRIRVAADRSMPARLLRRLFEPRMAPDAERESDSPAELHLVVHNSSVPPPVEDPRPEVSWVEEMIATFQRAERLDTRQQLLDDAMARAFGSCRTLRPFVDRIYEKDEELADRRAEAPSGRSLIETAAACNCDDIEWRALESLLVWHLQPLTDSVAVYATDLDELPDAGDETVESFLRGTLE